MIFPVLLVLLCANRLTATLFVGDECHLSDNRSGVYASVFNCPPVLRTLSAGNKSGRIRRYHPRHDHRIVCCPKNQPATGTTTDAHVDTRVKPGADRRNEISRRKCAEYAEFVSAKNCHRKIDTRRSITGGEKAEPMEFPHMAAVGYNLSGGRIGWLCGGTLISEKFVLSAAHCVHSSEIGNASWVRVGDLNLQSDDDFALPETRRIIDRIRHPDYKPPALYHDIALLRLESRVPFNAWIRPACLHTAPSTGTQTAVATGWGRVEWINHVGSDDLLKVTLSLVNSDTCRARWAEAPEDWRLPNGVNVQTTMCAGERGKDTCQGDSGGPLVVSSNKKFYCMYDVVAVTSTGKLCGANFPGIYTRVYHYVSWIESIVWPQG